MLVGGSVRTMRFVSALLLGCALLLVFGRGEARAQFTRFENLTDEQGLGNASVSALGQDADGYVLLGTEAGLYRYDGSSIAAVDPSGGLPADAWIRAITVDRGGWVWVVTTDALYVRRKDRFSAVDAGPGLKLFSPHLFARLRDAVVLDNGGRLIEAAVDARGVGRFSPVAAPGLGTVRFVAVDGDDALLAGCGTGLCRVENGRVERFGEGDGLPADAWQVAVRAPDGTLWVRSLDRIAWRRPGRGSFEAVAVPGSRGRLNVAVPSRLGLVADGAEGGVLTEGEDGLLGFDGRAWRVVRHHEGGLSATPIESMMFDREGSLWVGSLGHGAFRSVGWGNWEHWTAEDGLPSDIVWSAARPAGGGTLWVATYGDAVPLDGKGPGVPGGSENVVATRGGRLWFGPLRAPLARLDPASRRVDRVAIAGGVASVFVDGRNRLWVATDKGLWVVEDADAPAERLAASLVLPGPVLQAAADPAGAVWAVADGLYRREDDGAFVRVPAALPAGQTAQGLAFAPNGDLWVMTDNAGIARFRLVGGRAETLAAIAAPTVGSNDILFVYRDRRGRMWVGTDHGVDVCDGRGWRHLDIDDGLISNDLDQWAVFEDLDGSMWFGSSRGLSHLRNPARLPSAGGLHPLVTGVWMGRTALDLSAFMRVDWSPAPLVIRFVDLDFARGHNVTFRYRLKGVDTGWNDTAAHEVRYARLPAGRLSFELVAVDAAHHAVSEPIGFSLRVRAPWWRRWWFYALSVVLIGAAVAGAWQARVRLLLMQRRRLEAVVGERTAEIEQARAELQQLAMSDALTGLPNRRAVLDALDGALTAARASGKPMAVLLFDLDHFRRINEACGHLAGDAVLAAFGMRLKAALRGSEQAGRYGGEEFCVILPGGLEVVAERVAAIRSAVSDAPYGPVEGRTVTLSGGLAFLRPDDGALSLLSRADAAMYRAKQEGRNRVEYEDSQVEDGGGSMEGGRKSPASQRVELERDLRAALAGAQFSLHYQPVVDITRDVVTSCEALLRWQSPTRGRVSPVEFIPFAEQIGLMPAISDWVLRTACREAAGWPDGIAVSVNLSAVQFRNADLVRQVEAALAQSGLAPGRLELEVTETAMITEAEVASAMLAQLRALGIKVALDDFGTGYSSLSFLRTLPFDRIKIDRSFVQDLGVRREASVIVRAITGMCESLGASVTAEGVETDAQVEALRAAGCAELQGYRIGRPCPPAEVRAWMAARRRVLEPV